ncbi:MAG: thioredoxin domain-containing protein, partial [Chloroflexota bacterium]
SIIPVQPLMERYPLGFGQWLIALDYALSRPREIAIVGEPHLAETRALIEAASSGYRPHQVVAASRPGVEASDVPLLEGRNLVDGKPAAYVCIDYSCRPPVTDPEALQALLTGVHSTER